MKKQLLLFISMLLPMVAMADDSGSCGTNVTYTYVSSTGTLTIQGSHAMSDYSYSSDVPWFSYKADIKTVVIKDGVTSIGNFAFSYCTGLTSIEIPNSVTSIGSRAFDGCTGLTSVTIPNSVTSIGYGAFDGCSGLTSIEIPNSVTSIGSRAFDGCTGLTSVTIPNSVTSIGYGAFDGCSGLTSIEIPNSVTSIGDWAFYNCSSLTTIEIPNSVTSIGREAFYYCNRLTSIEIPNSVTSIADGAFDGCSALTSISVENGNPKYDTRDNCNAIIETSSNTLIAGCKTSIIPNSVTSIGDFAFYFCTGLTSIEIPNSVTSIGTYAFSSCSGLTSVTIGNSVTSIGDYAFQWCSGLTSIEIPNSVTSIGVGAFNGCTGLASVTVELESPLTIGNSTFSNCANATLYVPYGSKAAYEAANYWKEFKEIKEMPDRCATPTIIYKNGELTFDCETEGVKYVSTITAPESTEADGKKIDLSKSFRVSVYATKEGYTDSDIATQDINIRGLKGDVNDDGDVTAQDASLILQKVAGKIDW